MAKMAHGLGRGFESLIPQNFDTSILMAEGERIQKLPLSKIVARSDQPRQHFDETALEELAESIRAHGVLMPLVVVLADNTYQIIAGERRWRAAKLAGLETIPVIVQTLKELERLEIALIENVQRVDLSPLEQAMSIERLHQQFSLPYESISKRLGKAPSTVANLVRLLQLPTEARNALATGQISEGHARAILALKSQPDKQAVLLANIVRHGWSVRQAERFVAGIKQGVATETTVRQRVATETPETDVLTKRFGAPVAIRRTARGGRIELKFTSDVELERLLSLLGQR